MQIISTKANKADLDIFSNQKSNKIDTATALNGIEILHRQIKQVIIIVIQIWKLLKAEQSLKGYEKNPMFSKYSYLIKQSENVCHWVDRFDPTDVNTEYMELPSELQQFDMPPLSSRSFVKNEKRFMDTQFSNDRHSVFRKRQKSLIQKANVREIVHVHRRNIWSGGCWVQKDFS